MSTHCGHTSHSDVNASFNICEWEVEGISPKDTMESVRNNGLLSSSLIMMETPRSCEEKDLQEGSSGKPEIAMLSNRVTMNPIAAP